ncbi:hypothetical protein THAOC_34242 [Thalassiosira oceanica]|uniref:Uncharacterized protein n=1 Tax=Thalassiosira oceanica TaxID=159749 RepID=K0R3T4_THAOC|nr:hypothetical protein THAOC_34242 [Thalassiosira oceanica]|eukprot:EJK47065.1 hypothetical protein THAOC_34242 [Thalassiosira oceanica]
MEEESSSSSSESSSESSSSGSGSGSGSSRPAQKKQPVKFIRPKKKKGESRGRRYLGDDEDYDDSDDDEVEVIDSKPAKPTSIALRDSSNKARSRNGSCSKRKKIRPTSSGSGANPSGPSKITPKNGGRTTHSRDRDSRLASNLSSRVQGGVIGPGTKPIAHASSIQPPSHRSTGVAAANSRSVASSSVLSIYGGKYTASTSLAIENKLKRNKTTLACGAIVGLDKDQVFRIVTSIVAQKNVILRSATADVASYLQKSIPNKDPAKNSTKAFLAKLAVDIWGGLRLIDWSQTPRSRARRSTGEQDLNLQKSLQFLQETECAVMAELDEQSLSKATGKGVKLTPFQRQRKFLQGGARATPKNIRKCPRCGNEKTDLPPENTQAKAENEALIQEWEETKAQAQSFMDGETNEPPVDDRGRAIYDPKNVPNPKLKPVIAVCHSREFCHSHRPGTNPCGNCSDGSCNLCSSNCGFAYRISEYRDLHAYFQVEQESVQNRMERERQAAEGFLARAATFGASTERTALQRLKAADAAGEISMSGDAIESTASDERYAASAQFLVNNHIPTDAHNYIARCINTVQGARPTMTAAHGDLRTSMAAQRAYNTRLDTSLTSAKDDAAHFNLDDIDPHEQQRIYDELSSKPAAAPLGPGQAPSSDATAPQYVTAAIDAANDEQFQSEEDDDPERMIGLASVVAALSDQTSPRYSALLNILERGNKQSVDMKKLLTVCIRTLKA